MDSYSRLMTRRAKIFFLLWFIAVVTLIWYFARVAAYGKEVWYVASEHRGLDSPRGHEQVVERRTRVVEMVEYLGSRPLRVLYPFYFAATAKDDFGRESDFSNEAEYGYSGTVRYVTLAWDRSPTTNPVTYTIYKGRSSRSYTNSYPAGTNLTLTVPLFDYELSNLVVTVTTTNATNLAWASGLAGPWAKLNTTNWSITNPTALRYFRALGKNGNTVNINARHQ